MLTRAVVTAAGMPLMVKCCGGGTGNIAFAARELPEGQQDRIVERAGELTAAELRLPAEPEMVTASVPLDIR